MNLTFIRKYNSFKIYRLFTQVKIPVFFLRFYYNVREVVDNKIDDKNTVNIKHMKMFEYLLLQQQFYAQIYDMTSINEDCVMDMR